jgi:hypothetical protein
MKKGSNGLFALAIVALILSIIGAFGYDLWLASTQWLIVSIALTGYAIYLKVAL